MDISYKWLKNHINISSNISDIASILTSIGLEVESFNNDILSVNTNPNRSDIMSHHGIARDLYAILKYKNYNVNMIYDNEYYENNYINNVNKFNINVVVKDVSKCIRYTYVTMSNIKVENSPIWLKKMLQSIGIVSINNIIDICNFIMYDIGQPIYVFDIDKVKCKNLELNNTIKKLSLRTTDNIIRITDNNDLLLKSSNNEIISISGIIANSDYSIKNNTKNIYIESACYNPITIRKTTNKYNISNDACARFERGIDPNITLLAIYKTISLIKKIVNGTQSSSIKDIYPFNKKNNIIKINLKKIFSIIGENLPKKTIINILNLLNFKIIPCKNDNILNIIIPTYRNDIKEEIDIVEEILRIYGYDNINSYKKINIDNVFFFSEKKRNIQEYISNFLTTNGFYEIISNSINNNINYRKNIVNIKNPLNNNMKEMRSNLLDNMLNCISYNIKRKIFNINIFEWGKIYFIINNNLVEEKHLCIIKTNKEKDHSLKEDFFLMKNIIDRILKISGIINYKQIQLNNPIMDRCLTIRCNNEDVIYTGNIKKYILNKFKINQDVLYTDIFWEKIEKIIPKKNIQFEPISKYPSAKRDLSILVDSDIPFEEIYKLAISINEDIIKNIKLFDLYEDESLPKNKKSYGLSFYLQDINSTLTDLVIDDTIKKIKKVFKEKLRVEFR